MGRKPRKSKTERQQELQAAIANMEAQAEVAETETLGTSDDGDVQTAVVVEPEIPVLNDEERQADAANDAADAENDDKADGEEDKVPASIVPRKYRNEYKARGHARRCGDELSGKMESLVQDSEGNLVLERVYAIAKANGIEKTYPHLNPGQQRMNIGNILRRKLSEGDGKLRVPAMGDQPEAEIAIEPYYSNAQKDAA